MSNDRLPELQEPSHDVTLVHVPGDWYGPPLWGYHCACGKRDVRPQRKDFALAAAEKHGTVIGTHYSPPHPDMVPDCGACYGHGKVKYRTRRWKALRWPRRWRTMPCGQCKGAGKGEYRYDD